MRKLFYRVSIFGLRVGLCVSLTILLLASTAHTQNITLSGQIVDEADGTPLSFARISVPQKQKGAVADLDGRFSLSGLKTSDSVVVQYLGYVPRRLTVAQWPQDGMLVLREDTIATEEIVITPGVNPAHRIVRNAIENRKRNDPENQPYFAYNSYNKMKVAPMQGMAEQLPDTAFFGQSDIFLWESVTQRIYKAPGKTREEVLASRMSGLPEYAIPFTPTSIQDLSFYRNWVNVLGENFLSPLATNSLKRYFFYLQDTIYDGPDSIFVLRFKPAQEGYNGLDGELHIHSRTWAIKNIEANLRTGEDSPFLQAATIRQVHTQLKQAVWFPHQLFVEIDLSESFTVESENREGEEVEVPMEMTVKSYLQDIKLDTVIRNRDFSNVVVEVPPDAAQRGDAYYNQFRTDSLTKREANTYTTIDSIGEEINLDRKVRLVRKLGDLKLQLGPVDVDLRRLYRYNLVERHRLGLGLQSNERLSRNVVFGGWFGYGTRDKAWKYGGFLEVIPWQAREDVRLRLRYDRELFESGLMDLRHNPTAALHNVQLTDIDIRYLYLSRMHYTHRYAADVFFPTIRNVTHRVGVVHQHFTPAYDYRFDNSRHFTTSEVQLETRISPGEKFIATPYGRRSLGTNWPEIRLRYTQGLSNVLEGEFDYQKFEATIAQQYNFPGVGRVFYQFTGGYFTGELPFPLAYTFPANGNDSYFSQLTAFNTMAYNSWVADRYATGVLWYEVQNKTFPHVNYHPVPTFSLAVGVGQVVEEESFRGLTNRVEGVPRTTYVTPELGYYEAGFSLTNILPEAVYDVVETLRFLGVGAFYRFGPYQQGDNFSDDLVLKVALNLPFDI